LVLRGIDKAWAGKYRNVQVMIQGSQHIPPQPYLVPVQMEQLMEWYEMNEQSLHPVVLAARV
jgi:Fic family protein